MLELILAACILALDLVTKHLAAAYWTTPVELIPGVVRLTYLENTGAAWGMLSGAQVFFIILTVLFCAALVTLVIRNHRGMTKLSKIIASLIFAGALGNLIDRVFLGYVRDMIEPTFISFPVFNVADSAIVIGTILLAIEVLFIKDNLFAVVERDIKSIKKKKDE
ncbi:MAG: signal peptidase II [Clostridia bacterium]|nr:signal peptidase II [Clostridia bacterium]